MTLYCRPEIRFNSSQWHYYTSKSIWRHLNSLWNARPKRWCGAHIVVAEFYIWVIFLVLYVFVCYAMKSWILRALDVVGKNVMEWRECNIATKKHIQCRWRIFSSLQRNFIIWFWSKKHVSLVFFISLSCWLSFLTEIIQK